MATVTITCEDLPPLPAPVPSVAMLSAGAEGGEFRAPPPPPPFPMSTPQPPPARPATQTAVPPPTRPRTPERPEPFDNLALLGPQDRALAEQILRPYLQAQRAHRAQAARMAATSWH